MSHVLSGDETSAARAALKTRFQPGIQEVVIPQWLNGAFTKHEDALSPSSRIVGGSAANISYQLSLVFGMFHVCGATIIRNQTALTSASCVVGLTTSNFRVRAGSAIINSGGNLHQVIRITPHNLYNPATVDYDIAVVQIAGYFALGSPGINTINLANANTRPTPGVPAIVSGWGATVEGGSLVTNLQSVMVTIMNLATCRASYGNAVTDRMLCAGEATGGRGPCQGDVGGPLVVSNVLVGIVSWGYGCGRPNLPGVYTCVGTLRNWITMNSGV